MIGRDSSISSTSDLNVVNNTIQSRESVWLACSRNRFVLSVNNASNQFSYFTLQEKCNNLAVKRGSMVLVSSSPYKKGRMDALSVLESPKRPRVDKSFVGTLPALQEGDTVVLPVLPMEAGKEGKGNGNENEEKDLGLLEKCESSAGEQSVNQSNMSIVSSVENELKDTKHTEVEARKEETNSNRSMEEEEEEEVVVVEAEIDGENQEKEMEGTSKEKRVLTPESERTKAVMVNENECVQEKESIDENGNLDGKENIVESGNENENMYENENENEGGNTVEAENGTQNGNGNVEMAEKERSIESPSPNLNMAQPVINSPTSDNTISSTNPPDYSNPPNSSTPSDIQQFLSHFRLVIADLDQSQTDPKEIEDIQTQLHRLFNLSIDPLNTQLTQEVSDLFKAFAAFFSWFGAAETARAPWFSFFFFSIQFVQDVLLENPSVKLLPLFVDFHL